MVCLLYRSALVYDYTVVPLSLIHKMCIRDSTRIVVPVLGEARTCDARQPAAEVIGIRQLVRRRACLLYTSISRELFRL